MLDAESKGMSRARSWVSRAGRFSLTHAALVLAATASLFAAQPPPSGPQRAVARAAIDPGLGPPPAGVVRSSPAEAWRSFLQLAGEGRYDEAAYLLDLADVPVAEQRKLGPLVAEQLRDVLQTLHARKDWVTTENEEGPRIGGEPTNVVVAVHFERNGISGEVRLRRTEDLASGERAWLIGSNAVSSVPFWYRVLVKGEPARGAEPLDAGLGPIPAGVQRGTPREAMAGFLTACQRGRFGLAAFYLDLEAIPPGEQPKEGALQARRLMLTLQRTGGVNLDALSNEPSGTPEAGLPESEQRFAVIRVDHRPVELLLTHRRDPELGDVWTVSRETVAQIDRIYEARGYGWIGDHAPLVLFAVSFAGLQLWQWLALVVGLLIAWVVSRYLGRWAVAVLRQIARRTTVSWDDTFARALDGPLAFLLWAGILALVARWLGLAPEAWVIARQMCKLLALVGVGWFLLRLVDLGANRIRLTARADEAVKLGFLPMAARFAKGTAVVLVALAALDVIGLNVLALVAGLGLGGVALAFAAQKTLENVFGTISIAGDRPFEVGDYVTIGTDTGTVEDVGFRSTRLRTVGRTLVTIPNGVVAAGRVENFTARDRIMYNPVLGLAYDTSPAQIGYVIEEVKRLLASHPKVVQKGYRVRFASFGESSLNVEVWSWIATRDFLEYTGIVEELNFSIAEIVQRAGTSFAFPSRTIYMARDGVVDAARAKEIAQEMEEKRPGAPARGPAAGEASDEPDQGKR
jgi:MscS family membrane protein